MGGFRVLLKHTFLKSLHLSFDLVLEHIAHFRVFILFRFTGEIASKVNLGIKLFAQTWNRVRRWD